MLLRDEDDIGTVQFYSVIYNSVPGPHKNRRKRFRELFRFHEDICKKHVSAWSMTMLSLADTQEIFLLWKKLTNKK